MSYIVPRDNPKRCTRPKCRFMDRDTLDCRLQDKSWESFEEQYEHCPLIEIPTPHGRLGDLDALKAQYKYGEADSEDEKVWMMNIRRAIANAPTVIEAEE